MTSDLLSHFKWAYGGHGTESTLLRVMSDIYAANDRQDVTLPILLDLSTEFDLFTTIFSLINFDSN